ncbi:MAG TPA: ABC transporter ATP-binding protein [Stellaceae bacterium]|nr:ABC transporter ATP-binding protein [Stellaceae bacterium]
MTHAEALTSSAHRTAMNSTAAIRVTDLYKTYRSVAGPVRALEGIDVDIRPGEFVSLIGKSGCGKSTLLQIIAGLVRPSRGKVLLEDVPVVKASRKVGLVFQKSVLLEWRTILDNVLLPVELFHLVRAGYVDRARELLGMMGLAGFENSYPDELSGGMQQRAAIVRSLLCDPDILLMDEPFGALDALTREQMNVELLRIWQASGKTIIFVTHDIAEAVFLSDRVILLSERPGRVKEIVKIELPRPRTIETTYLPQFADYRRHLREQLG